MATIDDKALTAFSELLTENHPSFTLRYKNNPSLQVGSGTAMFTISIKHKETLLKLLAKPNAYNLAVNYINEDLDVDGDLYSALRLKDYLHAEDLPLRKRLSLLWKIITF